MAEDSSKRAAAVEIRAVVERIEDGDWAIIVTSEGKERQFDFPVALLPEAAREDGAHLRIKITVDEKARAAAEDRTRELLEKLNKGGGETKGKKDFKL